MKIKKEGGNENGNMGNEEVWKKAKKKVRTVYLYETEQGTHTELKENRATSTFCAHHTLLQHLCL